MGKTADDVQSGRTETVPVRMTSISIPGAAGRRPWYLTRPEVHSALDVMASLRPRGAKLSGRRQSAIGPLFPIVPIMPDCLRQSRARALARVNGKPADFAAARV